jgi:tRNA pseudouridine38-40 synthase
MQRYFIELSFDGSAYHGWQIQPHSPSVQEVLQRALSTLLGAEVAVTGAGRTDTGVHAHTMVAHFDWQEPLDAPQLAYRLDRILPRDIAVRGVRAVAEPLHARS